MKTIVGILLLVASAIFFRLYFHVKKNPASYEGALRFIGAGSLRRRLDLLRLEFGLLGILCFFLGLLLLLDV